MQKHDLPELTKRLAELADALGGKAPSAAGILVWLDALAECAVDDVRAVLSDWPKSHGKMPMPNEILKLARDRLSVRVEKRAEDNAKHNRKPWSPDALRGSTEVGKEHLRRIKAALAMPKAARKAWATRIPAGAGDYAQRLAEKVSGMPREADEAQLEREAIQAEGMQ